MGNMTWEIKLSLIDVLMSEGRGGSKNIGRNSYGEQEDARLGRSLGGVGE